MDIRTDTLTPVQLLELPSREGIKISLLNQKEAVA